MWIVRINSTYQFDCSLTGFEPDQHLKVAPTIYFQQLFIWGWEKFNFTLVTFLLRLCRHSWSLLVMIYNYNEKKKWQHSSLTLRLNSRGWMVETTTTTPNFKPVEFVGMPTEVSWWRFTDGTALRPRSLHVLCCWEVRLKRPVQANMHPVILLDMVTLRCPFESSSFRLSLYPDPPPMTCQTFDSEDCTPSFLPHHLVRTSKSKLFINLFPPQKEGCGVALKVTSGPFHTVWHVSLSVRGHWSTRW